MTMNTDVTWAVPASVLLRSLGHETRLKILHQLRNGESSADQLALHLGTSRGLLASHIMRLVRDNLITTRRQERTLFYSLSSENALTMLDAARQVFDGPQQAVQ